MLVKAKEGKQCPYEGQRRKHITDTKTVNVPETPYYLRLVNDGSLVKVAREVETTEKTVKEPGPPPDGGTEGGATEEETGPSTDKKRTRGGRNR